MGTWTTILTAINLTLSSYTLISNYPKGHSLAKSRFVKILALVIFHFSSVVIGYRIGINNR